MRDVTADYQQALDSPETKALVAERLQNTTVLLIRGYLSDAVVKIGAALGSVSAGAGRPTGIGEYFDAQMRWLATLGVSHERVAIESEDSVRLNAEVIRKRLEHFERVFLVSHSKGCLDTLEALLDAPAAVRRRIAGWVAIQGPFAGSPVADEVAAQPALRVLASAVLTVAGGSIASLEDMRTGPRREHLARNAGRLEQLLAEVPTVCLATSIARHRCATFLAPTVALIEGAKPEGGPNDGLVTKESAKLPGARFVGSDAVDHAMPVMPSLMPFDRVGSTQALLRIV